MWKRYVDQLTPHKPSEYDANHRVYHWLVTITQLKAFLAAMQFGSFTAAAAELEATPASHADRRGDRPAGACRAGGDRDREWSRDHRGDPLPGRWHMHVRGAAQR